jgi:hypothetical protein
LPYIYLLTPSDTFPPPGCLPAESIALENTEDNRRAYRELLVTTPGLGKYISGAIMFEETLFQSTSTGKKMTDCLKEQNIVPGIKVRRDKGVTGGGSRWWSSWWSPPPRGRGVACVCVCVCVFVCVCVWWCWW